MAQGKFSDAQKMLPRDFRDVYKHPKLREQIKAIGIAPVKAMIEFQLGTLASLMVTGGNLNDYMIDFISSQLIEMFPTESIADIKLCIERGAMGRYGEIQRMDGVTIGLWMEKYLDEKYSEVEKRVVDRRNNDKNKKTIEGLEESYARMRDQRKEDYEHKEQFKRDEKLQNFKKYLVLNGSSVECQHQITVETNQGWVCNDCGVLVEEAKKKDLPKSVIKNPRPKFICDGFEVHANDIDEATKAFITSFGRNPQKVHRKEN